MSKTHLQVSFLFLLGAVLVSGCATTRAKHDATANLQNQVTDLQSQLQAKDQEIQDLQARLESYERALPSTSGYPKGISSSSIKVPGVSVKDVQQALLRAGFDPGPADGRMGKKTRAAVKEFQRRNNLNADGIVGEKTWSLLKQ